MTTSSALPPSSSSKPLFAEHLLCARHTICLLSILSLLATLRVGYNYPHITEEGFAQETSRVMVWTKWNPDRHSSRHNATALRPLRLHLIPSLNPALTRGPCVHTPEQSPPPHFSQSALDVCPARHPLLPRGAESFLASALSPPNGPHASRVQEGGTGTGGAWHAGDMARRGC